MVIFGIERSIATSSSITCVGPRALTEKPQLLPIMFTFKFVLQTSSLICSKHRKVMNGT